MSRHPSLNWQDVEKKLQTNPRKFESLQKMEETGGESDVVVFQNKEIFFVDCCPESPKDRRSLCYDRHALDLRKEFKPKSSAFDMAKEIGVEILTEVQYKYIQTLGEFDTKTSSWIATPAEIRALGGAIFADRRYNHIFVYHNRAESYNASRGFRSYLLI